MQSSSLLYIVISIPQRDRRTSGGVKVYDVQSRRSVLQINSMVIEETPRTPIMERRTTTVIPYTRYHNRQGHYTIRTIIDYREVQTRADLPPRPPDVAVVVRC